MPSPAKPSPAAAGLLLVQTEDPPSTGKGSAAAAAAALERATEVVTHVETPASAGGVCARRVPQGGAGEKVAAGGSIGRAARAGAEPAARLCPSSQPAGSLVPALPRCRRAELASTSGRRKLGPTDFELLRIVGQVRGGRQ